MKRLAVVCFVALLAAFYPGSGVAYAQHTHGGGGGTSGMHVPSSTHGNEASADTSHGSSNAMSSTNPGGVLDHNSHLATKLENLLGIPNPGTASALTTLKNTAGTFKNFGQCVAAAHVSKNLGIPFSDLQTKMTGTNGVSLGKAIQMSKPTVNAKAEAKKAMNQAHEDVKESS